MKAIAASVLLASGALAHSAVRHVILDGVRYLARDARFDNSFGAKRIEWNYKNMNNFPWMAVSNVLSPAIACGLDASPPELKGYARAGSNATVQWSGILTAHLGPVMTYLGRWTPGQKVNNVKFFKITGHGYDKERKKWANEDLIERSHDAETFTIPSDIKPGLYILRTELLALHGNNVTPQPVMGGGPQYYTHCFNVEITGNGNAEPDGVTFPGGYKPLDLGVAFALRNKAQWDDYVVPGPPIYQGKHDPPVGTPRAVSSLERGAFPEPFQSKYATLRDDEDKWAHQSHDFYNSVLPPDGGRASASDRSKISAKITQFNSNHNKYGKELEKRVAELRAEAERLGYVS